MELAVDVVVFAQSNVLLVKRAREPYKGFFALPGGFVEEGELLVAAARRELVEETGVSCSRLRFCGLYDDPQRDPRGRVVSVGFVGVLEEVVAVQAGSDAAGARWVSLEELGSLAFDHNKVVRDALARR